tara:strand:+ start:777 stop:1934 length:1158 start_codon:yes stop_codon:yes gene_type:complete
MYNFLNLIPKFFKAKWIFQKPKKCQILGFNNLAFERTNSKLFKKYLVNIGFEIIHTNFEKINFFILLKCLINLKVNPQEYYKHYINESDPKIVLSLIDNSKKFWMIRKNIKAKTIFIQPGIRCHFFADDFYRKNFTKKKKQRKYTVDFMFVINDTYGKKYSSFIKGKTISIGSFKNNFEKKTTKRRLREICFISSFRALEESQIYASNLTWGFYNKNFKFFLKWLSEYSTKNNLKINIIGKNFNNQGIKEKNFYNKNLDGIKFNYFPAHNKRKTYKLLDRFEYVFTIDSTLGLENLARGGRTGFIGNTPNIYPLSTRKFGWNENLPKNGKFWTSENNFKEFQRIFDFVTKGKKKEWIKEFSKIKKIIKFDEKNKTFFNIINKILD